jgi:hypothetical protein
MELHVYNAISEVIMIPQINQFFLADGLAAIGILEKILVVETQRGGYFLSFSQVFTQSGYCFNILIHTKNFHY